MVADEDGEMRLERIVIVVRKASDRATGKRFTCPFPDPLHFP